MALKTEKIKSFKNTKAASTIEEDRYSLEAGITFIIDDFTLDNKNSYKENIAKINGRAVTGHDEDGSPIPGEKVKYWTFAKVIIEKLNALALGRELPCEVTTVTKTSKDTHRNYLDFDSGIQDE
jgi:hypothetical protein